VRCSQCRAALHDSNDDRIMDTPGFSGTTHGDTKPSVAPSDFKDTLVRTLSGHRRLRVARPVAAIPRLRARATPN